MCAPRARLEVFATGDGSGWVLGDRRPEVRAGLRCRTVYLLLEAEERKQRHAVAMTANRGQHQLSTRFGNNRK